MKVATVALVAVFGLVSCEPVLRENAFATAKLRGSASVQESTQGEFKLASLDLFQTVSGRLRGL